MDTTTQMSQSGKLTDDQWAIADRIMQEFDQKYRIDDSVEEMIPQCIDAMTKHKGTPEGDRAAFELFLFMLVQYDLPDPQLGPDIEGTTVSQEWTHPKPARIDVTISSTAPVAKVTLGKNGERVLENLSYEEAATELQRWFRDVTMT